MKVDQRPGREKWRKDVFGVKRCVLFCFWFRCGSEGEAYEDDFRRGKPGLGIFKAWGRWERGGEGVGVDIPLLADFQGVSSLS